MYKSKKHVRCNLDVHLIFLVKYRHGLLTALEEFVKELICRIGIRFWSTEKRTIYETFERYIESKV